MTEEGSNHLFQLLQPRIAGNERLREPQQEAPAAVQEHFANSNEHALLQIPVGCGKTGIMALLPFGIATGRVLVLTPNLTILEGVAKALNFSKPECFWRKTRTLQDFSQGPFLATLDRKANIPDCDESHFVVTNIHQLAERVDRWLPEFPEDYFDMILVDEGHHNVARTWEGVFQAFPSAKVVSLTATPFRSDGKEPLGRKVYVYPLWEAMLKGYVKVVDAINVRPSEIYFTYEGDDRRHSLDEVLKLREEAWFRRGVALSPECNRHIVEASIDCLYQKREKTGYRHQIVGAACSIDHARQVRSLYRERGIETEAYHSGLDEKERKRIETDLRTGRLDCVVQVQMLSEGFDHPPLSVAAIFRPYRSLSPYVQFVGRVLRVVHENQPGHADNVAAVVSHVGLNNDEHWEDFRHMDVEDQAMIREWLREIRAERRKKGGPHPRRFDQGMDVEAEILGAPEALAFLDPDDDDLLRDWLNQELRGGVKLSELISLDALKARLRESGRHPRPEQQPIPMPVQPQQRRKEARTRLDERTRSVAARVLADLELNPFGRDLAHNGFGPPGTPNQRLAITLMHREVNGFLGIQSNQRGSITYGQAESAFEELDKLGDEIVQRVQGLIGEGDD